MLINGMVYNSEVWSDVKESDVRLFEEVDEFLLRSISKAHSKTPLKYLFLESTGFTKDKQKVNQKETG